MLERNSLPRGDKIEDSRNLRLKDQLKPMEHVYDFHPPNARFRWGDIFTLRKDETKTYTVEAIYSLSDTLEVKKGYITLTFKLHLLEWLLERGEIIILKDGPDPDPRLLQLEESNEQYSTGD